jgi:large subunit ribosomal protein L3
MKNALVLKKIGMSQLITENGKVENVTVLQDVNSEILDIRTKEIHNYEALVVGYNEVSDDSLSNSRKGYFNKLKSRKFKYLMELKFNSDIQLNSNDDKTFNTSLVSLDSFAEKDIVSFKGKSKGKGFQGTIKVHGFHRGPMSHGSKSHRLPGSIGAGTDPARVFKGTKMAKRLGNSNVTIKNLEIIKIDSDNNTLFVKGAVPGNKQETLLMYK